MKILLHRGHGPVSLAIRWQTRSLYSHAGLCLPDGSVVEAWWPRVRQTSGIGAGHRHLERIDIFDFARPLTKAEAESMTARATRLVGARYDWKSVLRFVTRERSAEDHRWFCSELVYDVCARGGHPLLARTPAWRVPPDWIARSPALKFIGWQLA